MRPNLLVVSLLVGFAMLSLVPADAPQAGGLVTSSGVKYRVESINRANPSASFFGKPTVRATDLKEAVVLMVKAEAISPAVGTTLLQAGSDGLLLFNGWSFSHFLVDGVVLIDYLCCMEMKTRVPVAREGGGRSAGALVADMRAPGVSLETLWKGLDDSNCSEVGYSPARSEERRLFRTDNEQNAWYLDTLQHGISPVRMAAAAAIPRLPDKDDLSYRGVYLTYAKCARNVNEGVKASLLARGDVPFDILSDMIDREKPGSPMYRKVAEALPHPSTFEAGDDSIGKVMLARKKAGLEDGPSPLNGGEARGAVLDAKPLAREMGFSQRNREGEGELSTDYIVAEMMAPVASPEPIGKETGNFGGFSRTPSSRPSHDHPGLEVLRPYLESEAKQLSGRSRPAASAPQSVHKSTGGRAG